jgi:hypothetical protein
MTREEQIASLRTEFFLKTGEHLDFENPKTFNQKIQWIKFFDIDPLKTKLADKYAAREYVAKKIGEKYLVPLLGVWERPEDIDFEKLPNRFVLKCNHGSGYNMIVHDKSKLDIAYVIKKLTMWLKEDFAYAAGFEMQYHRIPRRIIAEEFIDSPPETNGLEDFKVMCFGGKAKYIMYLSDRSSHLHMTLYDTKWNATPYVYDHPTHQNVILKPETLEELLYISENLAEGFRHVRVDFYRSPSGRWLFGEYTFTSNSGFCKWNPPEANLLMGELIDIM